MTRLRTASARRLTAIFTVAIALALTAGIAQGALTGGGPVPPPKALANAILDAFNAPEADGLTADITFTNNLLPSGSLPGGAASPLAAGAKGRLWVQKSGDFRLELQADAGDAQIVALGDKVSVYDASSNTVYRATLPSDAKHMTKPAGEEHGTLTLAKVQKALDELARTWTVSDATPTSTAGQPTYTVRVSPKDDGGLLGAAELAWDSVTGAPLRAAVYAQGKAEPVLELEATDVAYKAVADSDIAISPPQDAKVTDLSPQDTKAAAGAHGAHGAHAPEVTGPTAVQRELDFQLAAPATLAGLPLKQVRLVRFDDKQGALAVYGRGFGAIAVLQRKAGTSATQGNQGKRDERSLRLPEINIGGASGTELATALGTIVTFDRGGVSYVVAGSVPPVAAENAARGLK